MIRGRLCLQLTDKVLLPATISYINNEQHSASSQSTQPCELTAEAGYSHVHDAADDNDDDDSDNGDGTAEDDDETTDMYSLTVSTGDSPVQPVHVEACEPSSAAADARLHSMETEGISSGMTLSLSQSEACDASLLQPLPTVVHIDSTVLHSADMTDTVASSDNQQATSTTEDKSPTLTSSEISHQETHQPVEWTRYSVTVFLPLRLLFFCYFCFNPIFFIYCYVKLLYK